MLSTNPVTASLIRARELIANPEDWSEPPTATTNCALTATAFSMNTIEPWEESRERHFLGKAAAEILGRSADSFGLVIACNRRGHPTVMRLFDKAIELSLASS